MRPIKHFSIWTLLLIQLSTFAQVAPDKYVVYFTDKTNTPYSIDAPESFLSQRAIERRMNADIAIDSTDLPVDPVYLDSVEATGAEVIYKSNWFNFAVVEANEVDILTIESFGFVSGVSKRNKKAQYVSLRNKFDFEMNVTKSTAATYEEVQQQINVDNLHDLGYRGDGMRIAVIDAGFTGFDVAAEFEHLYNDGRLIATRNVATSSNIYSSHTHGTYVSSIMAGDLGSTFKGVALDAEYILIRSETGATEYLEEEFAWVAAAEFADSLGADIINSSLGYSTFDWPDQNHTYDDLDGNTAIVSRAAGMAFQKGILVFTSAGNLGNDDWYYVSVPADQPDILTIGSVDIDGNKSGFSSVGLPEHLYKPDVVACGDNAPFLSGGEVYTGNGTSFSSPLVAGAAACLWQTNPDKTNFEIASAIRASASSYPNGDQQTGYGIPDFALAMSILNDSSHIPSDSDAAEFLSAYKSGNQLSLHIYSPIESAVEIKIYDLSGNLIYVEKVKLQPISVNSIKLKHSFTQTENQIVLVHLQGDLFNESHKVSLF
jgi:serine protease AprX